MPARSVAVTGRGLVARRRCCGQGALDETVDVRLAVADVAQAVRHADVPHQVDEDTRQHVTRLDVPTVREPSPGSGSSSRAAARCRSGAASKVHRNASGAVSATAMPCGTIGSSRG